MTRTYGQLTKKYREENDISIRKFAKMIGVGKSYLAKLETEGCTSTPTLPILLATAEVMEMDPTAFLKKLGINMESTTAESKETPARTQTRTVEPFEYIPPTLENLQAALKEGRIMVLPFKALKKGMLVYIPSLDYGLAIANEVTEVKGGVYVCASEALGMTEFTLFDIGHTVFTVRADAQKKLTELQAKQQLRESRLNARRKEPDTDA